ncbi:hypothetical protein PO909_003785, partial [Leuciscus waleckii]
MSICIHFILTLLLLCLSLDIGLMCAIVLYSLRDCGVTDEGCAALASALRSNPSHLRKLDLSKNNLGDSGVKLLKDLEDDPHYKLETL